jgi:hypothetical protein
MQTFSITGNSNHITDQLRQLRQQWGPPGTDWNFVGNYRQISVYTVNSKMTVWLLLRGFSQI